MRGDNKIAVAGATGRVGRHIVEVLEERGHGVVPISRSNDVDLVSGKGLKEALHGVTCVIDAATSSSPEQHAATEFFMASARNLQTLGSASDVTRIVAVSIIGCDRFAAGYGAAKVAHEQALQAGPLEVRILRASQFHEFVGLLLDWGRKGELVYVPEMRTQPVAARTVAEALVDLAAVEGAPSQSGAPPEIAGPREESSVELARLLVTQRGDPVQVEGVNDPSDPDSRMQSSGGLLPGPHATLAGPSFAEWLEEEI